MTSPKLNKAKSRTKKFRIRLGCMIPILAVVIIAANMILLEKEHMKHTNQYQPKEQSPVDPSIGQNTNKPASKSNQSSRTTNTTNLQHTKKEPKKVGHIEKEPTISEQKINVQPATTKKIKKLSSTNATMHVVFSTSCHKQQNMQAYFFFYQAMVQKQSGTVTRLVSGCDKKQEEKLSREFKETISIMSNNFKIHFTPEFGRIPKQDYHKTKYFAKPFSLRHWLESDTFGYNFDRNILSSSKDDDIIVLVDPDMLIQRPFVNYFPQYISDLWIGHVRKRGGPIRDKVSHGFPMAQAYGFGGAWLKLIKSKINDIVPPDSPVHDVSDQDARGLYSAGPPYIVTARDMYQISYYWTTFLPTVFNVVQDFMAEMYGYCLASAHLKLPHQLAKSFMVSTPDMRFEGWTFMENATETICNVSQYKTTSPQVLHYCQRVSIGEYFFSKYKLPVDVLSCDQPLLELPPIDIVAYTNYSHFGDGSITHWPTNKRWELYRNAYMVCTLMPVINEAATFFKDHHCPHGANYNQTWNTFTTDQKKLERQLNAARVS